MAVVKEKFNIGGMHCGACAAGIQMFLSNTEGVKNIAVNYDTKLAEIEYDSDVINQQAVIKTVEEVGYTAEPAK